jgi:hypothetical protein
MRDRWLKATSLYALIILTYYILIPMCAEIRTVSKPVEATIYCLISVSEELDNREMADCRMRIYE